MKLKEVKVYQSVNFGTQQETFFSPALARMKDVEIDTIEWGVRIKSSKDEVFVSFNNIAYAKPVSEQGEEAKREEPKYEDKKEAKKGLFSR